MTRISPTRRASSVAAALLLLAVVVLPHVGIASAAQVDQASTITPVEGKIDSFTGTFIASCSGRRGGADALKQLDTLENPNRLVEVRGTAIGSEDLVQSPARTNSDAAANPLVAAVLIPVIVEVVRILLEEAVKYAYWSYSCELHSVTVTVKASGGVYREVVVEHDPKDSATEEDRGLGGDVVPPPPIVYSSSPAVCSYVVSGCEGEKTWYFENAVIKSASGKGFSPKEVDVCFVPSARATNRAGPVLGPQVDLLIRPGVMELGNLGCQRLPVLW